MPEPIVEPDEAEKIAVEYIRKKENAASADIKIDSCEPISWGRIPVYMFKGRITRQTVDPTTWQSGALEARPFTIQITANEGKRVGYTISDWTKSAGQQTPKPETARDQRDEELRRSEIERNRAQTEYYENKMMEADDTQKDFDEWMDKMTQKRDFDLGL
jgi:hypothetical protein